jgi:hypothetical protein
MTKRRAFALLLPLLLLCIATASSSVRADDHQADHPPVIQVVEKAVDFAFIDLGAPGPSIGDRLTLTSDLFDSAGQKVGRDGGECVIVRIDTSAPPAEQQVVQCLITVELAPGQITFQGIGQGTRNFFAITGGTGAYRTARGQALVVDTIPGQEANITITIER